MSLGSPVADFLEPLTGTTTAFLLGDKDSKIALARAILPYLAEREEGCCVLDFDAFFSSGIESVTSNVQREHLKDIEVVIPQPGSDIEATLAEVFTGSRSLIIDSTNSLYHLLAYQRPKSASRKLAFLIAALSRWAQANSRLVIANTYEREPPIRRRAGSFSTFFDVAVSVSSRPRGLGFTCRKGNPWQNRNFILPVA